MYPGLKPGYMHWAPRDSSGLRVPSCVLLRAGTPRGTSRRSRWSRWSRYLLVAMQPAIRAAIHSRRRYSLVFSPAEVDITEPDVTPGAADTVPDDREHEKEEGKRTRCS